MKRFLAILLILCFSSVAAVYGEEVQPESELITDTPVVSEAYYASEAAGTEDEFSADSEGEAEETTETEEITVEAEISEEAELSADDRIYFEKNVYELNFALASSKEIISEPNTAVTNTWFSEGDIPRISIINKNASLTYGVADAPGREGELALRVYSPSTLSANVTNNYIEPYIVGVNPQYKGAADKDSWALMTTGDKGYAEFSFDFYTDGKTNADMRIGRYICDNGNGTLAQVNEQTFWSLDTKGNMKMRGTAIATFDAAEINNKWHTMKFVLTADNKYRVYMDGEALTEYTDTTYQGQYFRGISHFRLYNMATKGVSSEKYYDNFKYVVYEDITDIYELPDVSFDGIDDDTVTIEEDEEYTVSVVADSVCPKEINIYLDGELADTISGRSGEYVYTGVIGTHILEAEAVDATGAVSERAKLTFNVTERITISGGFNGGEIFGSYSDSDERCVTFESVCEDGLSKTEIYVNDNLADTYYDDSIIFDFSSYGTGIVEIRAVVYDLQGKSKAFDYTAEVIMNRLTALWSEDFEKYSTGNTSLNGGNIQIVHKNGYSKAVTTDDAHGTSMALGIEQDLGSDSGEYVNFVNSRPDSHVLFETEFYVSDYPADNAHIRFCMIESGSVQNNNIIRLGSKLYRTGAEMEYALNTWYKLAIDFNMPEETYSIYINGEPFIENVEYKSEKSNFAKLNYIRVYGPAKDGVPCYIAFDNATLSVYETYSVESVTGADSESICGGDNSFNITLSEQLNPDSLTPDRIKVTSGDMEFRAGEMTYNSETSTVSVSLKDCLIGGKEYRIELSGDIETSSGTALGDKIVSGFTAESVASAEFTSAQWDSDELTISLDSSKAQKAYVVYSAWNEDSFHGSSAKSINLVSGENEITLPASFVKSGDTVQICIINSLVNFTLLTDDIIKFTR